MAIAAGLTAAEFLVTEQHTPQVLFVCVHNAGRSQMAAAYLSHLSNGAVAVRSAGTAPRNSINPMVLTVMAEEGIDIVADGGFPKVLEAETVKASDVVITMGCGDTCPVFPGTRYVDWALEDPADKDIDTVRRIRDDIRARVEALIQELGIS